MTDGSSRTSRARNHAEEPRTPGTAESPSSLSSAVPHTHSLPTRANPPGWKIIQAPQLDWHQAVFLAPSFVAAITTAVYYVRWLDRWHREHANIEFAAARYKADMLRASWVAELAAETHQLGDGVEIPGPLLKALTRDLFRNRGVGAQEHPLEHLSGLVKRAKSIQLGSGKSAVVLQAEEAGIEP